MSFIVLESSHLGKGITFHRPDPARHGPVSIEDPALEVMTDLKKVTAITVGPRESLAEAEDKMKQRKVRSLIVVDVQENIQGLITAADILGEKPLKFVHDNGGTHADITVKDLMIPSSKVEIFEIKDVSRAQVGDIIETLKKVSRQHALVVDYQGPRNEQTVRGIFSLNQIARQLGLSVGEFDVEKTFSKIATLVS